MSLKTGMAWGNPLGQPKLSLEESVQQAAQHFKATRGYWPNFVRVSPADADRLGELKGLAIISDPCVGKSYRLLIGCSEEARDNRRGVATQ